MPPSRRIAGPAALMLAASLSAGACLPSGLRPTAAPPIATATIPPTPAPPTPTPVPTPVPSPTFMLYTVVAGDSLVGLATRFNTTGRSIAYWSRDLHATLDPESAVYDPNRLEIGWVIRIIPGGLYTVPMGPGDSPEPTPTPTPEPSAPDASGSSSPAG